MTEKQCNKCSQVKPIKEFNRTFSTCRSNTCRLCVNLLAKNKRAKKKKSIPTTIILATFDMCQHEYIFLETKRLQYPNVLNKPIYNGSVDVKLYYCTKCEKLKTK